ncbi:MAG: hypothetical protein AAF226_08415 [Verrucomicrobiota bacterium]
MKILITAVVSVLLTLLVQGLFSHGGTWREPVVLDEEVEILVGGQSIGRLSEGVTLHPPNFPDTIYTDPFDPRTYKIFVEFGQPRPEIKSRKSAYENGETPGNVVILLPPTLKN